MKKQIFILFIMLFSHAFTTKAQITLEHTLDSTYSGDLFYVTDIGNNDFKYVFLYYNTNSFSLYNMDMSPFLTNIQIPAFGDSIVQGFTVCYITKELFDCDSTNIEYIFENPFSLIHPFRVLRTDGTVLLQVDSANSPYGFGIYGGSFDWRPIKNTSDGSKLFLQRNQNQVGQILVYALCGVLPVAVYDFTNNKSSFVKVFPNPSTNELNFEINPPNNQEEFELVVIDSNAKENSRTVVRNKLSLDVNAMSSGTYFYSLVSKNKVYQSGKFILTK